jgi:hypothetical protein
MARRGPRATREQSGGRGTHVRIRLGEQSAAASPRVGSSHRVLDPPFTARSACSRSAGARRHEGTRCRRDRRPNPWTRLTAGAHLLRSRTTGEVINPRWALLVPARWHCDFLRCLDSSRVARIGPDERMTEALDLVQQHRGEAGRRPLQNPHLFDSRSTWASPRAGRRGTPCVPCA